jgi:hypothetical protein
LLCSGEAGANSPSRESDGTTTRAEPEVNVWLPRKNRDPTPSGLPVTAQQRERAQIVELSLPKAVFPSCPFFLEAQLLE